MDFKSKLTIALTKKGVNRTQIAKRLGVKRSYLCHIERIINLNAEQALPKSDRAKHTVHLLKSIVSEGSTEIEINE